MNLQKIVLTFFLIFSTFYFVPHVSAISLSIGDPDEIYGLWEDTRDQLNKDWQLFTEQKPVGDAYEEQFDKMISHIRQLGMLHRKFSAVLDIEAENNITIIYPNGGETFECDNTYPLAWSIDIAPNQTSIDALTNPTVGIYLSLLDEFGNGFIAHNIVTEMDAEIGKYKWTVPCELRDGSYSIRIVVNPEAKIISYEDT
ncbi:MAG: hypothetical protein KAS07_04290, partial [Candidatus Pacebacteria bacterium]|nr:hypothetical protein [Candidatus Paceibacterota bacterium]